MGEMITCSKCGISISALKVFPVGDDMACVECYEKDSDDEPKVKPEHAEIAERVIQREKRRKSKIKKPLLVHVKDRDKDGSSWLSVGRSLGTTLFIAVMIVVIVIKLGPEELMSLLSSNPAPMLFGLPGILLVWLVMRLITRSKLTVTNRELQVQMFPFPVRVKNRRVPLEEIRDFEVQRRGGNSHMTGNTGGNYKRYYLYLLTESGDRHCVVSGQSRSGTIFVEKTLKAMLAERDDRLPEDWKDQSAI